MYLEGSSVKIWTQRDILGYLRKKSRKLMHLKPYNGKNSLQQPLFTFMVVDETGVLPVSPTTTANGLFRGSSSSIFYIFFF